MECSELDSKCIQLEIISEVAGINLKKEDRYSFGQISSS
jgi:hypothetical protein